MQIGVIGLGYLGLTHAVSLAKMGHDVFGFESLAEKREAIELGSPPFFEPGLAVALNESLTSRSLRIFGSVGEAPKCDVYFICVGTPEISGGGIDTDAVFQASAELAKVVDESAVVVGKSTVPVGTARKLRVFLAEKAGHHVRLAWNPEFLREGSALQDSLNPDRIVISAFDDEGLDALREVYKPLDRLRIPVVEVGVETAELIKVASNAFLATKISFINAMAEVAEAAGADSLQIAKVLGMDQRIGGKYFHPGLGFGGGCLPKDIRGFLASAKEIGVENSLSFLREINDINLRRRTKLVSLALSELGESRAKKVLVLGASFKPNSDDMRDSPSLDVAIRLGELGAEVTLHDPEALPRLSLNFTQITKEFDLEKAALGAQLVILGTDWEVYRNLDPKGFGNLVDVKTIIDGRNVLDTEHWSEAGWRIIALGRNVHN